MKKYFEKLFKKPIVSYMAIWVLLLAWFWLGRDECGAGSAIVTFYIILPLVTIIASVYGGKASSGWKWAVPAFMGAMMLLQEYLTFSLKNTLELSHHWNAPQWELLLVGAVLSFIGVFLGNLNRI